MMLSRLVFVFFLSLTSFHIFGAGAPAGEGERSSNPLMREASKGQRTFEKLSKDVESINFVEDFESNDKLIDRYLKCAKRVMRGADFLLGKGLKPKKREVLRDRSANPRRRKFSQKRMSRAFVLREELEKMEKWFTFSSDTMARVNVSLKEMKAEIGDSLDYSRGKGFVEGTELTLNQFLQIRISRVAELKKISKQLKMKKRECASLIQTAF